MNPRGVRRTGLFNPERVQQLLSYNIEEGRSRYGMRMLVTLELWRRVVVDNEPVSLESVSRVRFFRALRNHLAESPVVCNRVICDRGDVASINQSLNGFMENVP